MSLVFTPFSPHTSQKNCLNVCGIFAEYGNQAYYKCGTQAGQHHCRCLFHLLGEASRCETEKCQMIMIRQISRHRMKLKTSLSVSGRKNPAAPAECAEKTPIPIIFTVRPVITASVIPVTVTSIRILWKAARYNHPFFSEKNVFLSEAVPHASAAFGRKTRQSPIFPPPPYGMDSGKRF